MDYDTLINKEHKLDRSFVPNDLVITDNNDNNFHNYKDPSLKPMISSAVWPYFQLMQEAALKEGFHLIIDSGYRSYDYQQVIWDKNVSEKGLEHTSKYVMMPGASEHQSGIAFDIAYFRNGAYTDDVTSDDPEYAWLIRNAHLYGFILRYPQGKEGITGINFEPWHFRFVGVELASYLFANDMTLEEYHLVKSQKDSSIKLS